jgi:hypothetical protein
MKVFATGLAAGFVAILALAACSSSSNKGNSSPPTCIGATGSTGAGSSSCNTCLQATCSSEIAAVQGACAAYVGCYSTCQCSDVQCLIGCLSKIDSTCQNSYGPFSNCLSHNCMSECAMNVGGDGG